MTKLHPFKDMKESAKAQHQVDKANWNAVKAESQANWEEAKLSSRGHQALLQKEREAKIAAAKEREIEAQSRIKFVKAQKN